MKMQVIYMFLMGILGFTLNRKHLLTTLLSMEFVILVLFLFMYMCFLSFDYELYFVLIFFTMSVCESAIGLSLMVALIRSYGNDYFNSLNVLW